jgi:hypothetical protein
MNGFGLKFLKISLEGDALSIELLAWKKGKLIEI